jgi:hypothetical protein
MAELLTGSNSTRGRDSSVGTKLTLADHGPEPLRIPLQIDVRTTVHWLYGRPHNRPAHEQHSERKQLAENALGIAKECSPSLRSLIVKSWSGRFPS